LFDVGAVARRGLPAAVPEGGCDLGGHNGDIPHRIQFCVLGPLRLLRDGIPVSVGGGQQRAVLAFLIAERERAVSVGEIADALWGERPPAGYSTTIQTYIFHLREVLEPERAKGIPPAVLVTEPGGYRLNIDPGAVDAAEFERLIESGERFVAGGMPAEGAADLRRALSLWQGAVLADLAGYDFVARIAGRLDERRLQALESRIDAELALGHHASMIGELKSLAQLHPLREHLQAQWILALYRAGRQADALAGFMLIRGRLMDELGIEPGAELTNLHQSMLNQEAALLLEARAVAPKRQPQVDRLNGQAGPRLAHLRSLRLVSISAVSSVVLAAVGVQAVRQSRPPGLGSLPPNSVVRIEPDGSFHDAVTVGVSPGGVVLADGAAWVANTGADTVSKIDLTRHVVVRETPVGKSPQELVVSGSDLWVVNSGAASVSRLSLKTIQVTDTIPVGNLPGAIAVGESGIWVANTGDDTVVHIDPTTGKTGKPVAVGLRPDGIAVDADTVWVSNSGDGTVSPIDVRSHIVDSAISVGAGPASISISGGAVWVANSLSQTISRIEPRSRRVIETIPAGDGPRSITSVRNRLWVANEFDGTVMTIDPEKSRVKRISTGASVRGLVSDGTSAYATTRPLLGTGHRGGVLKVTAGHLPNAEGIDPSAADEAYVFSAFSLVYDGLVGLRRTGGAAGLTLVPDLAVDLPRPSPDGLAYAFTLRRGIHYSNGAEVKPDDIRHGLQQELTMRGDSGRLANIVGAPACARIRTVCDLSRGIEVDDNAFQIVFHLRAPDPDFLYKLTEPLFATPEGNPGVPATIPRPATGPYMIGEYRSATKFTLVRNPQFHPWSYAAQPGGYPNEIEWTLKSDATNAVHDVLAGATDADERASAAADFATLLRTSVDHFHSDFTARTGFLFLNTRIAPFDHVDVRKAINLAVDRNRIVDLVGGASSAAPTCQVLPPNFPGYRRYCPYTANPTPDGAYHGPDLPKARALVDSSHTRDTPVTVVSYFDDPSSTAATKYVAHVLATLGYKARFAISTDDSYFSSNNSAQIGFNYMFIDYPAPANFFQALRCDSGAPGRYCNRPADTLFDDALAAQRTDPARSKTDWETLDQRLTNDAPRLSLYNLLSTIVVSDRVGNYLSNPKYGPLYGQMWVVN
jgi:YVTN family beta-propeller protein